MRELSQLHAVSSNGHCTHMSTRLRMRQHFPAVILTDIFPFMTVLANGITLEFKFTNWGQLHTQAYTTFSGSGNIVIIQFSLSSCRENHLVVMALDDLNRRSTEIRF